MGTWGTGLFQNDITCDVQDSYVDYLKQQLNDEEIKNKILDDYKDLIGTEDEAFFWYALSHSQWMYGRLTEDVKNTTLRWIKSNGGISNYTEIRDGNTKWLKTLEKLEDMIISPMPPKKIIREPKDFIRNPWKVGDMYAYQFHTKHADENGLLNKYVVFQKVGNTEAFNNVFSVVQIYNHVFDVLPTKDEVLKYRILPLVPVDAQERIDDFIPSFDFYLKTMMLYYKKSQYPAKYFTFINNQCLPEINFDPRKISDFDWRKDGMEEWLVYFLKGWENKQY